ncbi:hypothetical protein N0V90_008270 [Kalmusia sp. IMI 367209]|nr:hypothetical protein N0V90_008270 [Kalmusia sp. IMI 367209]
MLSEYKRSGSREEEQAFKRRKTSRALTTKGFSCFTLDGNDVNIHRRSAFSPKRKAEVKGIRKKGVATLNQSRIDSIIDNLLVDDVYLDFHIPFALNVEAASSHLARWLSEDEASPSFSVVGVFSCSSNTNLLQNALDPSLAKNLRLFVHMTTHLYTTGMQGGYENYTDEEISSVRDCVGNRLLRALDPLLRPSEIEASEDKLAKLRSLFLLLLGTIVFDQTVSQWTELESKQEALLRLLCHYLIYIGKATALLESSSEEKTLLERWRTQWNKPAAFTWNCKQGLEMHYRIEPPANWIVSSSEDESLSSIDVDLSEFDEIALFTEDGDLLKCSSCGTLWTKLDYAGFCQICRPSDSTDSEIAHLLSFESNVSFTTDQAIDMHQKVDFGFLDDLHHSFEDVHAAGQKLSSPATDVDADFTPFASYGWFIRDKISGRTD